MNQRTLQMCIYLKDWLDVEDRLQDQKRHDTSSDTGEALYYPTVQHISMKK